jgi:hypothetical protein
MSDTQQVGTTAVYVEADNHDNKVVLNVGPGTVYYGSQTVSSSSNDGNLTSGSSVTLTQGKWFISASASRLDISKPSVGAAYTQTYSTAARTVPNATVSSVATTAATQTTPYGYAGAAQADAIPVAINALAADVLALKKVITALIDDLQAAGIVQ